MWPRDYKQNIAGPLRFRSLGLVVITIEDSAIVEDESSPGCTVTDNADGTYDLTFPKGQVGFPLGKPVTIGVTGVTDFTAFSATAGTATIDIGAASLSGGNRCYVALMIGRA